MDNIRLILIMALIFIMLLIYQAWQEDYGPKPQVVQPPQVGTATDPEKVPATTMTTPTAQPPVGAQAPSSELPELSAALPQLPDSNAGKILSDAQEVIVETDVMIITLSTVGGDIRQKFLRDYPVSVDDDNPFRLMNDSLPNLFVAQSGILPDSAGPTHLAQYQTTQTAYKLAEGQETLDVSLVWAGENGLSVEKVYTFTRGRHEVTLRHIVRNQGAEDWQGRQYAQLQRTQVAEEGQSSFIYTYMGGAISSPQQLYEKVSFAEMADNSFNNEQRPPWSDGWVAMLQHYFVGAWVPPRGENYHYYTQLLKDGTRYVLGMYGQPVTVPAGTQHSFEMKLYAGPKIQDVMQDIAPGLELTVDYGWLWFISQPLFWLLDMLHSIVGNWGIAIILVTLLIKLAFFHLSATSYKSMAQMRKMQPKLMSLKERYGDDRTKMNQAMMDMYRKEKINPLAGCLPILVQIPVFIALYWVLLESVELRQASFMWLPDLSLPDPWFVLPLLMGATMLIQHHLNPAPMDPVQQKVMMMLPIIFTVFFAFFPAGLVLYWVVNNVLSIAQQWVITKKIAGDV